MEEKLRYEIRVTGRVQGVGFRWSAVTEAQKYGITGYIKNLYDGSVYIAVSYTHLTLPTN